MFLPMQLMTVYTHVYSMTSAVLHWIENLLIPTHVFIYLEFIINGNSLMKTKVWRHIIRYVFNFISYCSNTNKGIKQI